MHGCFCFCICSYDNFLMNRTLILLEDKLLPVFKHAFYWSEENVILIIVSTKLQDIPTLIHGPHPQHTARQCSLSHKGMPQLRDQPDISGTGSIICTAVVDSLGDGVCTCYLVRGNRP